MAKKAVLSSGKGLIEGPGESQIMLLPSKQKATRMEKAAEERKATAEAMEVSDQDTYNLASTFVLSVKEAERVVGEVYDEHVKKAYDLHKGLTSARKKPLDKLVEARRIVERKMSNWVLEQRRIEQAKAEKEQAKLIKQAEKEGDKQLVKDLKEEEVEVAIPVEKTSGIVNKVVVRFRITNELKVPRSFLSVDEKKIKAHIDKYGSAASIEGVEIYEDVQTMVR